MMSSWRQLTSAGTRCGAIAAVTAVLGLTGVIVADVDAAALCVNKNLNGSLNLRPNKCQQNELQIGSFDGTTLQFSGINVQIVDGSGDTGGPTNGLGNLIIGYNEDSSGPSDRTGSHNLVIGPDHSYSSFGGLVAGSGNTISGQHATVTGGAFNVASGDLASISGGEENLASGDSSSVSGGILNTASGIRASVSGGSFNKASGAIASVSGGASNTASAGHASVSGGYRGAASGDFASVSGGNLNSA